MNRARRAALAHHAGLGLLLLVFLFAARGRLGLLASPAAAGAQVPPSAAEKAIRHWGEGPRATARLMIAEYGPPDRASWRELRWTGNAPWAKTIVHRTAWPRILGPRKRDWLEQTVSFFVPEAVADALRSFDERIEINRPEMQVSARSPNEATNILLLNLAHEIAAGKRDVRSARDFAARTEALAKEGKTSAYMERLLFPPRAKSRYAPAIVPGRRRGYTEPK